MLIVNTSSTVVFFSDLRRPDELLPMMAEYSPKLLADLSKRRYGSLRAYRYEIVILFRHLMLHFSCLAPGLGGFPRFRRSHACSWMLRDVFGTCSGRPIWGHHASAFPLGNGRLHTTNAGLHTFFDAWPVLHALCGERRAAAVARARLQHGQLSPHAGDTERGGTWSLTSLRERLIKTGDRLVRHARYAVFQFAEAALPRDVFAGVLGLINGLRGPPVEAAFA